VTLRHMYSELIHFLKVRLLNYFLSHPILIDDLNFFFVFFFFLICPLKRGRWIQTNGLHFMRRDPQPIELPLGDIDDWDLIKRKKKSYHTISGEN
jgi:hypothetical protein